TRKQWQTPRNNKGGYNGQQAQTIEPGDAGIWATCQRGQEAKCVGELRDLFEEYAEIIYGDVLHDAEADGGGEEGSADIEAEIKKELEGMRKPTSQPLFTHVRLDIECGGLVLPYASYTQLTFLVMFFKTRAPIEPVAFVHRICEDAAQTPDRKRTRLVQRLSPMSLMGKATENGLAEVARQVLAPHFHGPDSAEKKRLNLVEPLNVKDIIMARFIEGRVANLSLNHAETVRYTSHIAQPRHVEKGRRNSAGGHNSRFWAQSGPYQL
ncbi:hypothetical protein LTR16_004174, partial [Cryomyces antarcticus]